LAEGRHAGSALELRQEPNSGQIGSDRAAPKVAAE